MSSETSKAKRPSCADLQCYWREKLKKFPVIKLPIDYSRPPVPSYLRSRETLDLDDKLLSEIKNFCESENIPLFAFLLFAFKILLLRYTGTEDILVGSLSFDSIRIRKEGVEERFVNPVGLRTDLAGDLTGKESLARVATTVEEASQYRDYPMEEHLDFLSKNDELTEESLFQAMFIFRDIPFGSSVAPITHEENSAIQEQTVSSDLSLIASESQRALTLECDYDSELFASGSIIRILEHFEFLLPNIITNLNQAISTLPILPDQQRQELLIKWNETHTEYPQDRCLHQLFEIQAEKTPNAIAVEYVKQTISYTDLNTRANQLAHHLQTFSVRPGTCIGIFMHRSLDIHVALLATLKAGGTYVPLDPSFPSERLKFMVENSGLNIILTQQSLVSTLPSDKPRVICIDSDWEKIALAPMSAPTTELTSKHLAYIIYTSGSTGVPKGVEIFHAAVVNFLKSMATEPGITSKDTLLSVTTLSFDISILELFLPLTVGAKVLLVSQEVATDGAQLHQVMTEGSPTVMQATPATWRMLIAAGWKGNPHLRIFCGGEALSPELAEELLSRGNEVWNLYGPTETTIWSARWKVESREKVLIGRPIANTEIYLLDKHLQPVPIGVAGELHIGGSGLARGYLKRPELTEEKFIAHPYSVNPADRLYKTGDLARHLPDGNIECLGRSDFQVKIRGFRIELGEIESALGKIPAVREAVVIASEDAHKENRLIAYFVANNEHTVTISEFREQLQATLPHYMIPTTFVPLDTLPLTPNGKVDRKSLPDPDAGVQLIEEFAAPRNATEKTLAKIWEEVLQIDQVGIDDNFFELGGHSLLATRLAQIIQSKLSVDIAAKNIFEQQTIRELAISLEPAEQSQLPEIIRLPEGHPKRLSFSQQALWMINKLHPRSPHYNIPVAFEIVGDLDIKALRQAFNFLIERHEILRTNYQLDDNGDVVLLIQDMKELALSTEDLRLLDGAEQASELAKIMEEESRKPFSLKSDLMLRVRLLKLSAETHVLLLTMHHIASDGWSLDILNRELGELYASLSIGLDNPLPNLEISYSDYASWQRNWLKDDILERFLMYWKAQLEGLPAVHNFPTDYPRPAISSYEGQNVFQILSNTLHNDLKRVAQKQGASLFMVLNAAFSVLLSRYSGETDIVIGSPTANRENTELTPLIGCFINTLVLRSDLSNDPTFNELLAQNKERLLGAYEHQQLPIELLVGELQPERSLAYNPLFQVLLVMEHTQNLTPNFPGLNLNSMLQLTNTAKFDFTLDVKETKNDLALRWEYATDLFDGSTIDRLSTHFEVLLNGIVANPDCRISALPLLTKNEHAQVLTVWNDTGKDYPKYPNIHTLFERQTAKTPDAVAVVFEEQELNYCELNTRANHLAHYLQQQHGVGPEVCVGLCMERSLEMIVALLGILKAGGAYVPLDPSAPLERLAFMAKNAALRVILTEEKFQERLSHLGVEPILLDADWPVIDQEKESTPVSEARTDSLAYVIYTSGSTGHPKGVEVEHRQVLNYIDGILERLNLPAGSSFAMVSPLTSDLGNTMLYPALATGGTLHIISDNRAADPETLGVYFRQQQPDCLKIVPSHLASLLIGTAPAEVLPEKCLVLGGEVCPWHLVEKVQALKPACRVINHYGPTETTIGVTTHQVEGTKRASSQSPGVPIGRPLANSQVYLLDEHKTTVPIGVAGEVYIGGRGLARGYRDAPELTKEKFLPHPYSEQPGARLYKTGDRGRFHSDGTIEFLGRNDYQVNVRGFRVELGEIESVLATHLHVPVVVVLYGDETGGTQRLIAYIGGEGKALYSIEEIKVFLKTTLPDYMIPANLVVLESLPMLPNGKIDRNALQKRKIELTSTQAYEPPRTELERKLSKIWEELLEVDRVGRFDNFFELGGHSLLSIRLLSQIKKELGKEFPMTALYEGLTIERLAVLIQNDEVVESSSLLVPIQTNGTKLPFFFTGLNGGFLPRNLSRCMGNSQPFYALLSESLVGQVINHFTVEEMAARLIAEIRAVQLEGPYLLGGFCGQAVVTFEMAHQFHAQGQKVELILFEEIAPGKRKVSYAIHRMVFRNIQRIKSHLGKLMRMESTDKLNYIKEMAENFLEQTTKKIRRKIAKENYKIVPKVLALQVNDDDRGRALRNKLWASYEPKVYPGPITLFIGSNVKYSHDPELGWGELARDGVDVQVVNGNHTDMLREPHVQVLADKLTACLAKAQAANIEKEGESLPTKPLQRLHS